MILWNYLLLIWFMYTLSRCITLNLAVSKIDNVKYNDIKVVYCTYTFYALTHSFLSFILTYIFMDVLDLSEFINYVYLAGCSQNFLIEKAWQPHQRWQDADYDDLNLGYWAVLGQGACQTFWLPKIIYCMLFWYYCFSIGLSNHLSKLYSLFVQLL